MSELKDSPKIRFNIWMIRNNLNFAKIAKKYGCGRAFVYQLIEGLKVSRRLVNFLIDMGCPADCFDGGRIAGSSGKGGSNGNV